MRLIDADGLKKAIIKHLCVKSENNLLPAEKSIYNCIDEQPTIEQQKIVRCKDCKIRWKGIACHYATGDDWFCADGVPKDGDGE